MKVTRVGSAAGWEDASPVLRFRIGRFLRAGAVPALMGLVTAGMAGAQATPDPYADAPPYMRPVSEGVEIQPLLTVGAETQLLGGSKGETFRLVGLLDGLALLPGKSPLDTSQVTLLVNHEFGPEQGGPAGPLRSGARVSEISLDPRGTDPTRIAETARGRYYIRHLFAGEPPVEIPPGQAALAKLCAASLSYEDAGFDSPVFFHGEEASSPNTLDHQGGLAFATIEGSTYALPRVGRAQWENIIAVPGTGRFTVLFALEDAPADGDGLNSQLYMYVGEKKPGARDILSLYGLNNGASYVLVPDDAKKRSEAEFRDKGVSLFCHWVRLDDSVDGPSANDKSFAKATRAVGAFDFVRIEDGSCDPSHSGHFYFVTTGSRDSVNPYGRMYKLEFDPRRPQGGVSLSIVLDGSEGIVSPDNIEINRHGQIAIQEDPVFKLGSGKEGGRFDRDASIWMYEIPSARLTRVAEMDRAPAVAHALSADPRNENDSRRDHPGGWESSGIIDAEMALGRGAWIFDVQAHSLRIHPAEETVEGGQILKLVWRPGK